MKQKRLVLLIGMLVSIILVAGCSTLSLRTPVASDVGFPTDANKYVILGRVTLETDSVEGGYTGLLAAAKKKFPNADDVVNIVVDDEIVVKRTLFSQVQIHKYILSGIALDYVDIKE